jgi:hypothetical protein
MVGTPALNQMGQALVDVVQLQLRLEDQAAAVGEVGTGSVGHEEVGEAGGP